MKVTQLNHAAIPVDDIELSCRFYADVLGLKPIPRPPFNFPDAPFAVGADQQLHLVARGVPFEGGPRKRRFALLVDDVDAFASHLCDRGIEFTGPKPRSDGAMQVFLADPDGHVIELFTAPR